MAIGAHAAGSRLCSIFLRANNPLNQLSASISGLKHTSVAIAVCSLLQLVSLSFPSVGKLIFRFSEESARAPGKRKLSGVVVHLLLH
jgi:hypothetical protein